MTKESFNGIGHRLQSRKRLLNRQAKVVLLSKRILGDVSLDVLPDLIERIELVRVRLQLYKFKKALAGLVIVAAVSVQDQDDGLSSSRRWNTAALTSPSWIMNCIASSRLMVDISWARYA